jgi:mono/diheme cytochrome c family protein
MRRPCRTGIALGALGAALLACSGGDPDEPETPAAATGAETRSAPADGAPTEARAGAVTFNRDIAPIVFGVCANCHRPGESAPFPLLSYEDTLRRAQLIAAVTKIRYMPPWQPAPGFAEFFGDRSLTDEQIALFAQWLEDGTPEGDPADLPPLPTWTPGWQFGEPDLVVELPLEYTVAPDGVDVFRNFVIPVPIESDRYVRSVEIRPGNNRVVHHATLKIDRSGTARQLDARDPEPGYDGMHDLGNEMPGGRFIGWTPGKLPLPPSRRTIWTLPAGSDLVLDLHMLPTGKPEPVRPMIGFIFTDEAPERPAYPLLLEFRHFTIPPGDADFTLATSFETPVDLEVSSIYPHAHYLGRRMSVFAELPDGSKRWLLRIERWDFNWQDEYRYAEPIAIPAGSTIHMQYSWDNSAENVRNPNRPPRPVAYGGQSSDEMGTVILQLSLRDEADLARLSEASARHRIARWPGDWNAHRRLGHLLAARGDHAGAIAHYRRLVRYQPELASGHYNLALSYQRAVRPAAATKHYRRALEIEPEHLDALNNLGVVLASQGKLDRAIRLFRRALSIDPAFARARKNLDHALALKRNTASGRSAAAD